LGRIGMGRLFLWCNFFQQVRFFGGGTSYMDVKGGKNTVMVNASEMTMMVNVWKLILMVTNGGLHQ